MQASVNKTKFKPKRKKLTLSQIVIFILFVLIAIF